MRQTTQTFALPTCWLHWDLFLRSNGDTELHLDNVSQFLEILPSLNARAVRGLLTRVDGRPPPEYVVQDDNGNPPEDMSEVTSSISSFGLR
jgi:hypothetical protein